MYEIVQSNHEIERFMYEVVQSNHDVERFMMTS